MPLLGLGNYLLFIICWELKKSEIDLNFVKWLILYLLRWLYTDIPWLMMGMHWDKLIVNWKYFKLKMLSSTSNLPNIIAYPQLSSVAQLCPTLRYPMDCNTPGFPSITTSWSLLKLESVMPSNHLILCHPLLLLPSIFPASGSFPVSQFFLSGGQSTGASASASVVPMNIQDWFPLGWTGWISLQSKRLSKVFSNTTFKSINSLELNCHIHTWLLEKP